MSTSVGLWSALIGATASLVVFVGTQYLTGRRDRRGRVAGNRYASLREAQDAALAVRDSLAEYGPLAMMASGSNNAKLQTAQLKVEEAFAHVQVAITRVDDSSVRDAVGAWLGLARWHFVSVEEVTTTEERQLWQAMNDKFTASMEAATAGRRPGRSG